MKKSVLTIMLAVVMALSMLSILGGIDEIYAANNPYPGNMDSNCTYAAWQKTKEIMGIELPSWGNAWQWYSAAANAGYQVDQTPSANSIVVFKQASWNSNYGHVAFVDDYNSSTNKIHKLEGNYNGRYYPNWAPAWESDMLGYIHFNSKPTAELSANKTECYVNESVTLSFGGNNTNTSSGECVTLAVWCNDERIVHESVYSRSYAVVCNKPGNYKSYMTAYGGGTYADSNWVYWTVYPNTGSEMTSGYERTIPDGDYLIVNAGTTDKSSFWFLDIEGSVQPAENETNVSLWGPISGTESIPSYEIWTLQYDEGFYKITQKGTNMALDVAGVSRERGANVQVWDSLDNSAQKWAISENHRNGYRLQAKCSGFSLDLAGGTIAGGNNIRQWPNNDADAQSWLFIPYQPEQPIENGRYMLLSQIEGIELDVPGDTGDISENTFVQIWQDDAINQYNSFDVQKLENGYYCLTHAASGKVLTAGNGSSENQVRIGLCSSNGSLAQQWAITRNGNGYVLRVRSSGLALDLYGGNTANGTPVYQWAVNGNYNQTWKFALAEHIIQYDANGGENAPGSQIKYYNNDLRLTTQQPSMKGYSFLGWSENATGNSVDYKPGDVFTKDKDTKLCAVWKLDHIHMLVKTNAISASCTKAGNFEYWTCSECGKYFSDSNGKNEISQEETIIKATGHSWNTNYTVDKAATCAEEGVKSIHCSVCDAVQEGSSRVVNKKDHHWDNGKVTKAATKTATGIKTFTCTVCGKTKTEAIPKQAKKANPLKIKVSKKTYKQSSLKKGVSFKIGASKAQGKVTYTLDKKAKKAKIKVTAKGKVIVPKNCKPGTYKISVGAAGNQNYKAGTKTVTIKIK